MRKVIVNEFMTLDGVVQSPSSPDEDGGGGFEHGGWNRRYIEDTSMKWLVDGVSGAGGFLLGRRDLRDLRGPLADRHRRGAGPHQPMNALPKYSMDAAMASG